MSLILNAENLSIGHDKIVAKNITLSLSRGEILVLSGKNGSGKSTFIKTILGEIAAKAGEFKLHLLPNEISYLPQLTNKQIWASYTNEEIFDTFDVPELYRSLMSNELRQKRWIECSGGEKQRLLVLTRLREELSLLILDEPFNFLDDGSVLSLQNFLSELMNTQTIKAMIVVSHIPLIFAHSGISIKEWSFSPC